MRILLHAANLSAGGGLAVGVEIIHAWLAKEVPVLVLASPQVAALLEEGKIPPDCWMRIPKSPGRSLQAGILFRKIAREAEKDFRPDVVFTVFGPPLWRPRAPHLCGFANGLYFPKNPILPYGGAPYLKKTSRHRLRRRLVFRSLQKDADALWVETEAARKSLRAFVGKKAIHIVPNELSAAFKSAFFTAKTTLQKPYTVLVVAAGYPHKNFSLLRVLAEHSAIAEDFTFQTTLPSADFQQYFSGVKNVQNLGLLSPKRLVEAYQNADFIFAPSRAEIFSATWIEAFAAKRPLLCADLAAAREICGPAALYFEDNNPLAAAAALQGLAASPALQATLVRHGSAQAQALLPATSRADLLYNLLLHMTSLKPHLP